MFEHYGFWDLLYAIKKYFLYIVIAAVVLGGIGGILKYDRSDAAEKPDPEIVSLEKSAFYFISGDREEITGDRDILQANLDLTGIVSTVLNAEYTRQAVYDRLTEQFSAEDILLRSGVEGYKEETITYGILSEFVKITTLSSAPVIRINVTACETSFADRLLELYNEKVADIAGQLERSHISCRQELLGKTENILTRTEESESLENRLPWKYILVFAVAGGLLALCVVFVWTLFVPVLNRRDDIEDYGIPLLADRRDPLDFAIHKLEKEAEEKGKREIGLVCCDSGKKEREILTAVKKRCEERNVSVNLVECRNVAENFEAFEAAEKCDAVILLCQYSKTTHASFQRNRMRLEENNIPILGCIAR